MKYNIFSSFDYIDKICNTIPIKIIFYSNTNSFLIQNMIQHCFLFLLLACLTIISVENANTRPPNIIVRASNMTESMKQDAIRITKQAFIKFDGYSTKSRSSMAQYIRYQFEQLHQPAWQCILGKDYALSINSENEKRIILDVDKVSVLIFKGKC